MKSHRNCTVILPGRPAPEAPKRWMRERTHGCWCSAWRELKNGELRVWRRGAWRKPCKGELRNVKHPERYQATETVEKQ